MESGRVHIQHCLRGPERNKATAVRNIADVLTPDGVLFGGTVLGLQSNHTKPARAFLRAANKQGGFDNVDDTVEGLRRILEMSFSAVDVDVVGSAALFAAARPRSPLLDTQAIGVYSENSNGSSRPDRFHVSLEGHLHPFAEHRARLRIFGGTPAIESGLV